jgi:hypothetical protein
MDIIAGSGRQILGLFVVFSLLGLTVWKLRGNAAPIRWGEILLKKAIWRRALNTKGLARQRALETIERLPLTPQHTLYVLRLRDREMLVATHPQGCTLLNTGPAPEASPDLLARGAGA